MYQSKKLYELCFRADQGLPLPARPLIRFLIQSALARTQRDSKVILGNQVWMANHPHLSFISQDVNALRNFYGELKKRLTDMLKRLLGLKKLRLWPKEPTVCEILDIDMAVERHVYYFLNPARASLVNSIDEFPGESTWQAFVNAEPSVDAKIEVAVPWIRLPTIPVLSRANPSRIEEARVIEELIRVNKEHHLLVIYPFAWIKAFGVTDRMEVQQLKDRVIRAVREKEVELLRQRAKDNKGVFGATRLQQEPITVSGYEPKKEGESIFFLSSLVELRQDFLARFKDFCTKCKECFEKACVGYKDIVWPPGAFVPPIPPLVNPI